MKYETLDTFYDVDDVPLMLLSKAIVGVFNALVSNWYDGIFEYYPNVPLYHFCDITLIFQLTHLQLSSTRLFYLQTQHQLKNYYTK